MKRLIPILLFSSLFLGLKAQQDPQYTMYFFNMAGINPAYAGSRDCGVLTFIGRRQWVGFNGSPQTGNVNYHQQIGKTMHGIGVNLVADHIGPYTQVGLSGMFAYRFMLGNNWRLAMALQLGGANLSGDLSSIPREVVNDPYLAGNQFSVFVPNAGFGAYLDSRKYFVGFAIPRLFENRMYPKSLGGSEAVWARHMNFHAGMILPVAENVKFRPSVLVKMVDGIWSADLNASFLFQNTFWAGVSYRRGDALTAIFEWYATRNLRVGYAYDFPVSSLFKATSGSHEVMIRYEFTRKSEGLVSPRFF